MNETVLHYLGQTWTQAADVGEVLETASRIDASAPESWSREWRKTAERLSRVGDASVADGHRRAAGHAYLRAATYYRAALHRHTDPRSPEVAELARREVESFQNALTLSGAPCAPVAIPYEATTLPGYFCRARTSPPAPIVIFHSGRDAWAEDGKYVADEALARGYHALLFDGPGQGKTLRLQGLTFRPDWESVITPVIDFALAQPGVDHRRVALWAESMGGYLGPRAAALERRLRVLIANPGVPDWYEVTARGLEALSHGLLELLAIDDEAFDARVQKLMSESDFARWGVTDSMWKHGVQKPSELMHELERYRLGGLERQIRARTLVVDAEAEDRGQARALYDRLQSSKGYLRFTAQEAAQFHDQPGAKAIGSQRVFDWLDENL